jgi:hypothetical protein
VNALRDPQPVPEVRLQDGIFRPSAALHISETVVAAVRAGLQPASSGLRLRDANALLEPGYLALENGYARLDDATLYVSALTPMPGVTGEMIDWWFAWHGEESARYQLWHPRDHISAHWRTPVSCAAGSDRTQWQQLYRNNVSEVDEYVGSTLMRLAIAFAEPSAYLDVSRFESSATETVICGRTYSRKESTAAGRLLHQIRRTSDGVEMRSRFWLADFEPQAPVIGALLRPLLNSRRMRTTLVPDGVGRDLLTHCAEEMAHLAEFLPALFNRVNQRG